MFFKHLQRTAGVVLSFLRNQSGSILVYTGAFMAIGVGGAALSIDIGRIVLLKTQMQNRADAGALAGAAQLDGQPGAIERAEIVVDESMLAYTTAGVLESELITVEKPILFYEAAADLISIGPLTTDSIIARFVRVTLERRTLSFFYGPAMNLLNGQGADNSISILSQAVGMSDPFICKMQPLMICDPFDDGDPLTVDPDIGAESSYGSQIRLKQAPSSGAWQPGNFGLLDLPDDAGSGANAVYDALSAEDPYGCYAANTIDTAPGVIAVKVRDGVNVRWEGPDVAPNAKNYPKDYILDPANTTVTPVYDSAVSFGTGEWPVAQYWTDYHPGMPLPVELSTASRYQMYLFEIGEVFCTKSKGTKFNPDCDTVEGGGWKEVSIAAIQAKYPGVYDSLSATTDMGLVVDTGSPDDNWLDGRPLASETISAQEHARRLITIAVAKCETYPFTGNSEIPGEGTFIELFLTEEATDPVDGVEIHGELVRKVDPRTSLEFHGNVRLVE